ncbi:MAG: mechanosensitive ion channel family protein [Microbacteriaceae bacterium]|nr:mechanosensitive ion channel family protein [Microbacteriaceae bacterium]
MDFQQFIQDWEPLIRITLIIIGAIILTLVLRLSSRRIVNAIVNGVNTHARELADKVVEEQRILLRTKTIASVLDNFILWAIAITSVVMILGELGVNIGALIAVTSILGAAIGFGAQSLVKDILSGIFIVFEDQYGVGDWVDLGSADGEVEKVGLRVTELRDVHGTLWFVRNGEILRVGNYTQDWARALLDLPFSYENDIDKVNKLISDVSHELAKDPQFNSSILGDPEIWGMDYVSGEQFVIRVALTTKPSKQWAVTRELRSRLKARFDKEGISLQKATRINLSK